MASREHSDETLPTQDSNNDAAVHTWASPVPAATLIYHPDLRRVGERCILQAGPGGEPVLFSRVEGRFAAPGSGPPRPFEDPYVTREPVCIAVRRDGGLEVTVDSKHRAELDGRAFEGTVSLDVERLTSGVTLAVSKRVMILLHRVALADEGPSYGLIGRSAGLRDVRSAITNVADLEVSVLLRGETGVGKDRVARAIHAAAGGDGPFIAVNMASVSPNTAASELFGHTKGAFTGADKAHDGLFRQADGGTLFLDEVGELALDVQAMLLRVLETRTLRPLGATLETPIDVRVISATDSDLEHLIELGGFRPALLHRLDQYRIEVPPLRVRKEDVPRLAAAFIIEEMTRVGKGKRVTEPNAKAKPWLHRDTMRRLFLYDWPGNVRQLRNAIRQLVISSRSSDVAVLDERLTALLSGVEEEAPASPSTAEADPPSAGGTDGAHLDEAKVLEALARHRWMFGATARELGLSRTSFYRLVARFPSVRKGPELGREELEAAHRDAAGDLDVMSDTLRVSRRAIGLRLAELGIG